MPVKIAHGYINNLNSASSFTITTDFQPKAGIFWFVAIQSDADYDDTGATNNSVAFWKDNNGTPVYVCHAMYRLSGTSSYFATYTDCISAWIDSSNRRQFVTISNVSSNGLSLQRSGDTSTRRFRLHWMLFGGDVNAEVKRVSIPNNTTWTPITVSGAGFEVGFFSYNCTENSTPTFVPGELNVFCTARYDTNANNYTFSSNALCASGNVYFQMNTDSAARMYMDNNTTPGYIAIANVNNGNDLRLTRNFSTSAYPGSFACLSIKNVPAWSSYTIVTNATTSVTQRTYTFPSRTACLIAIASVWGTNGTTTGRATPGSLPVIISSDTGGRQAFSIVEYPTSSRNYSSTNRSYLNREGVLEAFNDSYWEYVSNNGLSWTYNTKTAYSGASLPIFFLGLGEGSLVLSVSSSSSKTLSRQIGRLRTLLATTGNEAVLIVRAVDKVILEIASASLASFQRGIELVFSLASSQQPRLHLRRFVQLFTDASSASSLQRRIGKVLHVMAESLARLRLPERTDLLLEAASESIATLTKQVILVLEALSDQASELFKTVFRLLRAFSDWQAWIEFKIFKLLEVVSDTRNDIEKEVIQLFRQWEQELLAVSDSLAETFRTYLREITARAYQWARLETIRGPVFALRSWLWRVNRRKPTGGCE